MLCEVLIEKVIFLFFPSESRLATNFKSTHFFFAVLLIVLLNLSPQLLRQELEWLFFIIVVVF